MPKGYQFLWRVAWPRYAFRRYLLVETDMAYIYDWILSLGFLQIRKWSTRELPNG